ncbi:MAG: hypothetical protein R2873_26765 [Caldilineaceae bacterium]
MTPDPNRTSPLRSARVLIIGLTATIVVLALAVVGIVIASCYRSATSLPADVGALLLRKDLLCGFFASL